MAKARKDSHDDSQVEEIDLSSIDLSSLEIPDITSPVILSEKDQSLSKKTQKNTLTSSYADDDTSSMSESNEISEDDLIIP